MRAGRTKPGHAETSRQVYVRDVVKSLQDSMNAYSDKPGYLDYSDDVIIEDVFYALWLAMGGNIYRSSEGYRHFKHRLYERLKGEFG